jgi:hypothetical protein
MRRAFIATSSLRRIQGMDQTAIHVCRPLHTTRTLCGEHAGRVAAVNYAEFSYARGPFCQSCEREARRLYDAEALLDDLAAT